MDTHLAELLSGQARLEEKVDGLVITVEKAAQEQHGRLNLHSKRLGSLERSRAWIYGALVVLKVGAVAVVGALFGGGFRG